MKNDKYKASGIDWIGDVPNHWSIKRIKDYATVYSGSSITNSELLDEGYEVYGGNGFMGYTNKYNVKAESIIIGRVGAKCGNVKLITEKKWISDNALILKKIKRNDTYRYVAMLLDRMNLGSLSTSTAQPLVTGTKVLNQFILFPSLEEQNQIAQYLDTKSQAIDKKINLLNKKADYYKELRKSLINETVCKGLDKNVKLKESGIEWICKIPQHWKVKRFKDVVAKYTTGGTPSTSNTEFFNGNNIWICISDISDAKYISNSKMKLTDEALKSANIIKTPKGSLLYSFKLSIGKMAFVTEDVYTNEAILSIFPNKNIDLEYYYFMLPMFMLLAATENIYGAKMLNQKLIANAFVLHPPKEEQTAIGIYLDEKTQKIDAIVNNIGKQIETLKELRKTLINDVVTGKIKVTI